MSLRARLQLYCLLLWASIASCVLLLFNKLGTWFFLAELALLILAIFGFKLIRSVFDPLDLLAETTQLLSEQEFTTRLRPVGQREMDVLIGTYNQMSEILRRQRLENLEQASFLAKVLETTQTGIVILDFDGRIERINPAAQTFLDSAAMVGQPLNRTGSMLGQALEQLGDGETTVVHFRGRRRVKCVKSHFLDRGFRKDYYFIDELTDELRHIEKAAYEKLVRVMSHEINNSLGAAHSLLQSCLHYAPQIRAEDREDFSEAIQVALSRTDHLKTFVAQYVSVVKLPKPVRTWTHLGDLVDHVGVLMSAELAHRHIDWQVVVGAEAWPRLFLDRLQMEQVLLNVVKNAMDAIERDGTITIALACENGRLILAVQDTGGGIPPALEPNLFTPFYTTKPHGQGIGLTLVAEILSQHGYDFSLDSPPGEQTRFRIWLTNGK